MKQLIYRTAIFFYLFSFGCYSYSDNIDLYTFKANVVNAKDSLIAFEYVNKSNEVQCLRADDLEFKFIADSLYVNYMSGEPVKYIGVKAPVASQIRPKKFFILPPNENMIGTLTLRDYYSINKKDVYVSYSIPVIDCNAISNKSIYIPPVSVIKDKLKNPVSTEKDLFFEGYPEWSNKGFIAISEKLLVSP